MADQLALMHIMGAGTAALRPGPDEKDDPEWAKVSVPRQNHLLIAGELNAKMRGYLEQIRWKHARDRSPMEQWTVVIYNLGEVNDDLGPAPPVPAPVCPSQLPFLITTGVLVLVCVVLILFMSWRRGWKQPFGACAGSTPNSPSAAVSCG